MTVETQHFVHLKTFFPTLELNHACFHTYKVIPVCAVMYPCGHQEQ